jgi:hypothetical protein
MLKGPLCYPYVPQDQEKSHGAASDGRKVGEDNMNTKEEGL